MNNNSKQRIHGWACRDSKCNSGYQIDVVKSAMQKYLRRREAMKMKWCAIEIYKFKFGDDKRGSDIFTNLINRLIVMLDEELCSDEVNRYLEVDDSLEKLKTEVDFGKGVVILSEICDILCSGKMLRLCNDIGCYFNREMETEDYKGNICFYDENLEFTRFMRIFIGFFEEKNPNCYYWLFKIYNMTGKSKTVRYRRREYVYGIWSYLEKYIGKNEKMRICFDNRIKVFHQKDKKERYMFLIAMVNICMYRDEIDWDSDEVEYNETGMLDEEWIGIDDYCIDMHCGLGRSKGKNETDFALEGMLVVDEYIEKWKNDEWRKYYISQKVG
jgi:hypothetical protein